MLKNIALTTAAAVTMVVVPSRALVAFARKVNMFESISALERMEKAGVNLDSWLPPIFNRPKVLSDRMALDGIALRMSGKEWDSDTIDTIAEIVRLTGRTIEDAELIDMPDRRDAKVFQDLVDSYSKDGEE